MSSMRRNQDINAPQQSMVAVFPSSSIKNSSFQPACRLNRSANTEGKPRPRLGTPTLSAEPVAFSELHSTSVCPCLANITSSATKTLRMSLFDGIIFLVFRTNGMSLQSSQDRLSAIVLGCQLPGSPPRRVSHQLPGFLPRGEAV